MNSEVEESSLNAGNDISIHIPGDATPTATKAKDDLSAKLGDATPTTATKVKDNQPAKLENARSMYEAAIEGNWKAAEKLLRKDMDLGREKITDDGDTALHLAVSRKHTKFVRKLIAMVGWEMVGLHDGKGNIACHYAVMDGNVELVGVLTDANPFITNLKSRYETTTFMLAVIYGNSEMVSFLLRDIEIENLAEVQWFDLLVLTIRSRMLGLAIEIVVKKGYLEETQVHNNRTALHVLAQLDISSGETSQTYFDSLAKKLWENIQRLKSDRVLELMKKPPILQDAARAGNLNLIKMITVDYPDLLSNIHEYEDYIFTIILMHRKKNMLELVKEAIYATNSNEFLEDGSGHNLLHLAAMSRTRKGVEIFTEQDVQLEREFAWFKDAVAVLPPFYVEMRNNDGYTPIQLFWNEHAKLLAVAKENMKKTAESCMLISTIVLTLVFAAAFAPPGGFNQTTGIPELLKEKWFVIFIICQALALSTSAFSIIRFWSIISFDHEKEKFFAAKRSLRLTMCVLLLSVLFVISSFLSAFFLVFVQERKVLLLAVMLPLYLVLVGLIIYEIVKVSMRKT